jgi:predicted dehydrogenase
MRRRFERLTGKPAAGAVSEFAGEPIDVVSICVPTPLHAMAVDEVLSALKPRLLLCEKPIADNERDGSRIVAMARRRKIGLVVNYIRRWQPATRALKRLFDANDLGHIMAAHCYYTRGVLNNASHGIDLFSHWFGAPRGVTVFSCKKSSLPNDVNASFALSYGTFPATFQCGAERDGSLFEIDVVTDRARIWFSDREQRIDWTGGSKGSRRFKNEMNRYQLSVVDDIAIRVHEGGKFESDGASAMAVLKIGLEVLSQCKSSR